MALPDFPNNPTLNEQFTVGTNIYQWDGEKWKALSNADNSLRSQLADVDSTVLVGGVEAKDLAKSYVIDIRDFGAVGDGVADDTQAIRDAVAAAKNQRTLSFGSQGGGSPAIYVPKGFYRITERIDLISVVGLKVFGDGARTSVFWLDGVSETMFFMRIYIQCSFDDIGFYTGAVAFDPLPRIDPTTSAQRTNICFDFDGVGGGTMLNFNRCRFMNFDIVFNSTPASPVNIDGHKHDFCQMFYNNIVWNNTNTQAVIWKFIGCQMFFNDGVIFKNPASSLTVNGGDYINAGTFLEATLASTGVDSQFQDLRFETYQNLDPTASPKWLVLSGSHQGIRFVNVSAKGGGSLGNKVSVDLSGTFDIAFENCNSLSGQWNVLDNGGADGVLSNIKFVNCRDMGENIVQTVSSSQGNRPININFENHTVNSTGKVDRSFVGASASQGIPTKSGAMVESVRFQGNVSNTTLTKSFPIFTIAPYELLIAKIEVCVFKTGAGALDITFWSDSSKTTKIAEVIGFTTTSSQRILTLEKDDIINYPSILLGSNPIFVEFSSPASAGIVTAEMNLHLRQGVL